MKEFEIMEYLDPLTHVTEDSYINFWQTLFATIFFGFWSKVFAGIFLFLAFWFGVRLQRFRAGLTFFFLTILTMYGSLISRAMGF